LKRIVTAFFEYDLNKDKMRWNNPKALTVDERLTKIGDLCNWGYDSLIEDSGSKNFNDVMTTIKSRVFDEIKKDTFEKATEKALEDAQEEFIKSDITFKDEFINALYQTSFKTGTRIPTKEELMSRGTGVPGEPKKPKSDDSGDGSNEDGNDEGNKKPESSPNESTNKPPDPGFMAQLYKKVFQITKTFINALVIKSAEPIDGSLNIQALLEKYQSDKKASKGTPSCSCKGIDDCIKTHDNLYDTVYCELKSYAMKLIGKDKLEFSSEIHEKILNAVDKLFTHSPNIVEWNIYIEKFIEELKSTKIGGGKKIFAYTRKNGRRFARNTRKI
jgi:hypothetical protein